MILGFCPQLNTGPIPTQLAYAGFLILFFNLLKFTGGLMLTTLLLVFLVGLGFVSGSIWVLTAAVGALLVKMFPLTLVFFAIVAAVYLAFSYYNQR
jgi:hypothetical protein